MSRKNGLYAKYIKRFQDFILSLVGLIVLCPVFVLTALLVRIKLGGPVIFSQERPGLNEKIFTMYKFRTMTNECDADGQLLPDQIRLTKFGKFLRATSLDELPELINILKGDMSIVGPRPLLVSYLDLYNSKQRKRHDVRPGLTGLAQVNGRNAIDWDKKFEYDLDYIESISFLGDWRIIFATAKRVFVREGISSSSSVTMEPFKGNS